MIADPPDPPGVPTCRRYYVGLSEVARIFRERDEPSASSAADALGVDWRQAILDGVNRALSELVGE